MQNKILIGEQLRFVGTYIKDGKVYDYFDPSHLEVCKKNYFNNLNNLRCLSTSSIIANWKSLSNKDKEFLFENKRIPLSFVIDNFKKFSRTEKYFIIKYVKLPIKFLIKNAKDFSTSNILSYQDIPENVLDYCLSLNKIYSDRNKNFLLKDLKTKNSFNKISRFQNISINFIKKYKEKINFIKLMYNKNLTVDIIDYSYHNFNNAKYYILNGISGGDSNFSLEELLSIKKCIPWNWCLNKFKINDAMLSDIISVDIVCHNIVSCTSRTKCSIDLFENKICFLLNYDDSIVSYINYNKLTKNYCFSKLNIYDKYLSSVLCCFFNEIDDEFIQNNLHKFENYYLINSIIDRYLDNVNFSLIKKFSEYDFRYPNQTLVEILKFKDEKFFDIQKYIINKHFKNVIKIVKRQNIILDHRLQDLMDLLSI